MQTVYRIENSEHCGPYYISMDSWTYEEHSSDTGRPSPWMEKWEADRDVWCNMVDRSSTRFGFSSRRKLKAWFTKSEREALHDLGYFLSVYKARSVIHGSKQVIFDLSTARRLRTEPLKQEEL